MESETDADAQTIESIAAAGESNLLVMPSPIKPTVLRRLPPDFRISPEILRTSTSASPIIGMNDEISISVMRVDCSRGHLGLPFILCWSRQLVCAKLSIGKKLALHCNKSQAKVYGPNSLHRIRTRPGKSNCEAGR